MFDGLSRSLEKAWDSVRKDGKLTADNIKEPMREVRWAAADPCRAAPGLCRRAATAAVAWEAGVESYNAMLPCWV
jgi:hypothetical protein